MHYFSKLSFSWSLCKGRVEVIWAGCGGKDCRAFFFVVFLLCAARILFMVCREDLCCLFLGFPHRSCDIAQRDLGNCKISPIPKQFLCWERRSFLFKQFSLISGNDSARSLNVESRDVALRMAKSDRYSHEQQFSSPWRERGGFLCCRWERKAAAVCCQLVVARLILGAPLGQGQGPAGGWCERDPQQPASGCQARQMSAGLCGRER